MSSLSQCGHPMLASLLWPMRAIRSAFAVAPLLVLYPAGGATHAASGVEAAPDARSSSFLEIPASANASSRMTARAVPYPTRECR